MATPDGERPIAALLPGDLVFSVEGQAIVAVPVLRAIRTPVETDHPMIEVELAGGETIRMSPGHPTGDGRTFAELATGGRLGDRVLTSVRRIAYGHAATHDILPASSTGIYFVAGVPVGSTLRMGRNTAAE